MNFAFDSAKMRVDDAVERMGERELYLEISHFFAGHLPELLVELEGAMDKGEWEKATRLAHSLKGNCATVGAEGLRPIVYDLEKFCRAADARNARMYFTALKAPLMDLRAFLLDQK